jgi:uroporphyrinogen decarboxylase
MMNVANKVKDDLGDAIDLKEYKYTSKENIARCMKMGVEHLPSMYINGELKYSSIIPGEQELIQLLQES